MLAISKAQLAHFDEVHYTRFEQRCLTFLREHFPQLAGMSDPAHELEAVRAGIQCAHFRDFHSEQDIVKYLYLRQLLGAGFDVAGPNAGLAAILNDQSLPSGERLDRAMDAVAQGVDHHGGRRS